VSKYFQLAFAARCDAWFPSTRLVALLVTLTCDFPVPQRSCWHLLMLVVLAGSFAASIQEFAQQSGET
jgi:hypothetical protein